MSFQLSHSDILCNTLNTLIHIVENFTYYYFWNFVWLQLPRNVEYIFANWLTIISLLQIHLCIHSSVVLEQKLQTTLPDSFAKGFLPIGDTRAVVLNLGCILESSGEIWRLLLPNFHALKLIFYYFQVRTGHQNFFN